MSSSVFVSPGFESSRVGSTSPITMWNCSVTMSDTLAAGGYWLLIFDATSAPSGDQSATKTPSNTPVLLGNVPLMHVLGQRDGATWDVTGGNRGIDPSSNGVRCTLGCTVVLSSAGPTNVTPVANAAVFNGLFN
jgi:hypothetical protein